jgi:hypothetical protein
VEAHTGQRLGQAIHVGVTHSAPAVYQAADFAGGFGCGFQAGQRMNLVARPIVRTGMGMAGHYAGMVAGAMRPLLRIAKTAMGH